MSPPTCSSCFSFSQPQPISPLPLFLHTSTFSISSPFAGFSFTSFSSHLIISSSKRQKGCQLWPHTSCSLTFCSPSSTSSFSHTLSLPSSIYSFYSPFTSSCSSFSSSSYSTSQPPTRVGEASLHHCRITSARQQAPSPSPCRHSPLDSRSRGPGERVCSDQQSRHRQSSDRS